MRKNMSVQNFDWVVQDLTLLAIHLLGPINVFCLTLMEFEHHHSIVEI